MRGGVRGGLEAFEGIEKRMLRLRRRSSMSRLRDGGGAVCVVLGRVFGEVHRGLREGFGKGERKKEWWRNWSWMSLKGKREEGSKANGSEEGSMPGGGRCIDGGYED
jgi:hypothetical protein